MSASLAAVLFELSSQFASTTFDGRSFRSVRMPIVATRELASIGFHLLALVKPAAHADDGEPTQATPLDGRAVRQGRQRASEQLLLFVCLPTGKRSGPIRICHLVREILDLSQDPKG